MKAKVQNLFGENVWMSLPAPLWEGAEVIHAGVKLTGLWKGEKSGRMVARLDSVWINSQTNCIEGETFAQTDTSTWLWYCEVVGIDPQTEAEEL